MSEDPPTSPDARILYLEQAMDEMKSQGDMTNKLLQNIMDRLGPPVPPPTEPTPQSPTTDRRARSPRLPPPSPSTGRKKPPLKPSTPPDFNGNRAKGKAFLTSCRTYIRLCSDSFEDDTTKIVWAMSYMKEDRAARWAERELEYEAAQGDLRFIDWLDFEAEFRKDFLPLNAEATAVNILEGNSYFQGRRSVDDYLDQFRDLIYDLGYTDPKTIVVKFRRGLERRIASAIGGMATGRPSDTDAEGWFEMAVQLDQNRAADEAFQASHRSGPTSNVHSAPRPGIVALARPTPTLPPRQFAHTTPTPGNPVPMDIDAARKARQTPDTCRRCGKIGHWAKDCDLRFDVRHLTDDELGAILEQRLAALDVASSETEEESAGRLAPTEDFVPCSE